MVMYLVESTMPETGEVRFFGRDQNYIDAGQPHRFVRGFALEYGFNSYYAADFMAAKMPGVNKTVIRAEI